MFSEIVKITPRIDRSAMQRMFSSLNTRFASTAKKFGAGLKRALKAAPFLAIAGAFAAKLLNPLQKAEGILDRILGKSDDAVTDAEDLGTTPGKLLRLMAVGGSKGADAQTMKMLLSKFQVALAREQEAVRLDPTSAPGILREYVKETDTAEAFFKFIQAVNKLEKSQQVSTQFQIFGEGERIKGVELFTSQKDFADILKALPSAEILDKAANKMARLNDLKDFQREARDLQDLPVKAGLINEDFIHAIDRVERQKLRQEGETLKRFDASKETTIAVQELTEKFDNLATEIFQTMSPTLKTMADGLLIIANFINKDVAPLVKSFGTWADQKLESAMDAIISLPQKWDDMMATLKSSRIYKYFGGGG